MASAFLAIPRGSRLYGSPVVGSRTSQVMTRVVSAKNGSMVAVTGSGIRHMSDSLIAFQPAMEEPSNIRPSGKGSSSIMPVSKVTCCHLPRGSVKRRSTYLTSLSLIAFKTSLAVFMNTPFLAYVVTARSRDGVCGSCSIASRADQDNMGQRQKGRLQAPHGGRLSCLCRCLRSECSVRDAWRARAVQAPSQGLDRVQAGFAGSDSDGFLDVGHENLA